MKVLPVVAIAAILISAGGIGAYAVIDMQGHEYSITYVLDGGVNGDNPDKYNSNNTVTLNDASKEGYTFDGWYLDKEYTKQIFTIHDNGDVTVYAKWNINDYTLMIHYVFSDQKKAAGDYTAKINIGEKYSVDSPKISCYSPDKPTVSGTMTAGGITETVTYTPKVGHITYELYGGTNSPDNPETFTILDGEITLKDASKQYYTFDGWYLDDKFTSKVTSVTYNDSDITLYAKWTPISETITYNLDGGVNSPDNPASFTVETPVTLSDATKTGYKFEGWYADAGFDQKVDVLTFESGIRTLYAKWTVNSYTLTIHYTYSDKNVAAVDYSEKVAFGTQYSVPSPEVPCFSPDKPIVSGTMGAANVEETVTYYADVRNVIYVLNGGINGDNPATITVLDGEVALKDASKQYYTFDGWYLDDKFTDKVTSISYTGSDITLYAKWTPISETITYNLDGGVNSPDNPASFTVETPVALSDATKTGYKFEGWYADAGFDQKVDVLTFESGIRTLYAKWTVNSYTLTIHYLYENQTKAADDYVSQVNYGSGYSVATPTKTYFTPDKSTVSGTMGAENVTENVTYIADVGNVTYVLYGGTNGDNPATITALDGEVALKDASKKDHEFIGWYLDDEFTENVTSIKYEGSDITLYAFWIQNAYKITYVLNGGTNSPDNPDTIGDGKTVYLSAPTKEGYNFVAWLDEENDEITTITGAYDITVTALWIKDDANTIVSYSISGTYTEYKFIIIPVTSDIRGLTEFTILDYDEVKGYHYYNQQYIRIGEEEKYETKIDWTGALGPCDDEYIGISTITTAFGEKTCFVMMNDDGIGATSYLFVGCDDGIKYRLETTVEENRTITKITYDLNGIADIDREETFNVTVFDGVGITTVGGGKIKVYSEVTLTAYAGEMTSFKGWYDSYGNLISESPELYFEMLLSDVTLYALNDSYFDVFTKTAELSMTISEVTGIEGLHDVTWVMNDDGTRIPGNGDNVSLTLSEHGPKALVYNGIDGNGTDRFGFILIWYEDLFTTTFEVEFNESVFRYTLNICHLENPYYDSVSIPRLDSMKDTQIFVTYDDIYVVNVVKGLKISKDSDTLTGVQSSQFALNFAYRLPYISEDDVESEKEFWKKVIEDLKDSEDCSERASILYSALIRVLEYDHTLLVIVDNLGVGIGTTYTTGYCLKINEDEYLYYDKISNELVIGKIPKDMILKNVMPVI